MNCGEALHSLDRAVFYSKQRDLHQGYRDGQEDQLNALGLVVNATVLWNTRYMEHALAALRQNVVSASEDGLVRLSPLGHDHIIITIRLRCLRWSCKAICGH